MAKQARTMNHKCNETTCHGKAYKNIKTQEHQNIGAARQKEHVGVVKHKNDEVERACRSSEADEQQNKGATKHGSNETQEHEKKQ